MDFLDFLHLVFVLAYPAMQFFCLEFCTSIFQASTCLQTSLGFRHSVPIYFMRHLYLPDYSRSFCKEEVGQTQESPRRQGCSKGQSTEKVLRSLLSVPLWRTQLSWPSQSWFSVHCCSISAISILPWSPDWCLNSKLWRLLPRSC